MASMDLRRLSKLHAIDKAILEIRNRAAALDPGRKIMGEIKALESEFADKGGSAKSLSGELKDLELAQQTIDAKIKKIDSDLYGGKIVNPREVENLEKERENLKRQRGSYDERILELWELVPPAKEEADKIQSQIDAKKKELAEFQKKAVVEKERLEAEFKRVSSERPAAVKEVPPALLAKYESIRQKHGGIGMATVEKGKQCGACGMLLPERTLQLAREDKVVTCESCHRVLYYTEGLV